MEKETRREANDHLRSIREEQGWTQEAFAEKVGVTRVTVARWESGITFPPPFFRRKLCLLLNRSEQELGLIKSPSPIEKDVVPSQQNRSSQVIYSRSTDPIASMDQNRHRFLSKLYNRYTDILDHSLQGATPIALALHSQPNAVINTTRVQFRQTHLPEHPLSADIRLLDIYDQASGELLLLGDPGAGKTTLLLHLAQTLCQRARLDEHTPLPVIVNLSTWANTRKPLQEWLVEDIARSYQVPRSFIARLMQEDEVLPLLDGLDEVPEEHRSACIEAINTFTQHHLVPLIVCSRRQEYMTGQHRLLLHTAVVIQPLEEEQVDDYFQAAGASLSGIRSALRENAALRELVRTPLMLHVVTLAYQEILGQDLPKIGTREEQQHQIFEHYVQRRVRDQEASSSIPQTLDRLSWLAQQMRAQNQTVFYLEHLQPDWLPAGWLRQVYEVLAVKFTGILIGVLVGLLVHVGVAGSIINLSFAVRDGLVGGLLGGLISGSPRASFQFTLIAKTWTYRWKQLCLLSISNGVFLAITTGIVFSLERGLHQGIIYGLSIGLCGFLLSSTIEAGKIVTPPDVPPRAQSQRWWHGWLIKGIQLDDLRLGTAAGLLVGVCFGLGFGLNVGLNSGLGLGLNDVLIFGIISTVLSLLLLRRGKAVELTEIIRWSGKYRWFSLFSTHQLRTTLLIFLLASLFLGLGSGLRGGVGIGLLNGLQAGLIASVLSWVLRGIWYSLSSKVLDDHHRMKPNQGIRWSVSNGIIIGVFFGGLCVLVGLLIALFFGPSEASLPDITISTDIAMVRQYATLSAGLRDGLVMGILGALLATLLMGGLAGLRHLILRVLLAYAGVMPWQTVRFLDEAARRILLYKDGGGYRFIHRLFLDHFADLEAGPLNDDQQRDRKS